MLNPIVAGILVGTAFGFTGLALPRVVDATLELIATAALPLSLIALGMGLAEFGIRAGWRMSVAISALKLAAAAARGVRPRPRCSACRRSTSQCVVLLAALPVGANVYLMARQFGVLGGPVASGIVLTTALRRAHHADRARAGRRAGSLIVRNRRSSGCPAVASCPCSRRRLLARAPHRRSPRAP